MLYDSHAHYDDERFDEDRMALLADMPSRGVGGILCVAADIASGEVARELAETFAFVHCSAGIHPHVAKEYRLADEPRLRLQLAHPKCVAVGEMGLDYALSLSPHEIQREVFAHQLGIARELDLPVIVHDREAHADTLTLLERSGCRGVVHCYSGSAEMAARLVELGFYLSFAGVITFPNARKSLEVLRVIPPERILIETDAPYLAPVPHRGKRNDSSLMRHTCEAVADVLGLSFEETARLTADNTRRCFGLI